MTTTVIDKLIVTLGLDPTEFKKGTREADKQLDTTKKKVTTVADDMGRAVTDAAKKFALAFLSFQSAAGVVRMLSGLNEMTRQLSFVAANTNESAAALHNWANAAEDAGGTSAGLLATVQQIAAEQSKFSLTGQSNWLAPLAQLGLNSSMELSPLRDRLAVLMDLTKAFEHISKGPGGRQLAFEVGVGQMGIDPGTMNFILQGTKRVRELLAREGKNYQVSDKDLRDVNAVNERWQEMRHQLENFGLKFLSEIRPLIERLLDKFGKWLASIDIEKLGQRLDVLVYALGKTVDMLEKFINFWSGAFDAASFGPNKIGEWLGTGLKGLFSSTPATNVPQSDIEKGIASAPDVKRAMELNPFFARKEGLFSSGYKYSTQGEIADVIAQGDEATLGRWLAAMQKTTGKTAEQPLTDEDRQKLRALWRQMAISAGQAAPAAQTGALLAPNPNAANSLQGVGAPAQVAGANVTNTTQIDSITINTAATDAHGIMRDVRRDLQRKGLVAQADYGLVS